MIELLHISKTYRQGTQSVHALRDVSFSVQSGEFVAVIGASGSGKSTLMSIVGCLDEPTEGQYSLFGTPVEQLRGPRLAAVRNREIGFVFQHFNLVHGMSALKNVELPLVFRGESPAVRREKAEHVLRLVGLEKRMEHVPSQLSGGQQQRVAIARALVGQPRIILADEPTGNLDAPAAAGVMELLEGIHQEGRTVVLITHDPAVAARAGRIVRMENGRITAC